MFDILVYLYETYYRPDACPEPAALARKLSAVGFDEVEISEALDWLNGLTEMAGSADPALESSGTRFYIDQEVDVLGTAAERDPALVHLGVVDHASRVGVARIKLHQPST